MAQPQTPPLSSFGWSLTGALALSLSLPPVGFFLLAWVALVPLLVRWSTAKATLEYARELYAVFLTLACCAGFWLLFHPNTSSALLGGFGLFLQPLPLIGAFLLGALVRQRFGLTAGLVSLVVCVVASEFLLLRLSFGIPWLLLGHTQVQGLPFIQIADLGGVLLLSLWVLLLNVFAFLAIPSAARQRSSLGDRGISVATFAILVTLSAGYGAFKSPDLDTPAGFTRLGVIQPGIAPATWQERTATERISYLAELSDHMLSRQSPSATGAATRSVSSGSGGFNILVWPQNALPYMGSGAREARLMDRLGTWAGLRGVTLITGAQTTPGLVDRTSATVDTITPPASSAVLIRPGVAPVQYDQMRRLPLAEAATTLGNNRTLFRLGTVQLATVLGFESIVGDHVRRFTQDGANVILVLAQNDWWGRSGGYYQHMGVTRLRAVENRRAVVMSTMSGGTTIFQPTGETTEASGWMEQGLVPLDVPIYRAQTIYAAHGDWVGLWALWIAVLGHVIALIAARVLPQVQPEPRRMAIPFR